MITKRTITSVFFVPTLNIPREGLFKNNFINAYLDDVDKEEYYYENNMIFLLFKPDDLKMFRAFLDEQYENNKDLIDDYDYEGGYVVLVYKLNTDFKKDFDLVRAGLYSRTSSKFKQVFPKQIQLINSPNKPTKPSLQWMIFNKHPDLIQYIEDIIDTDQISKNDWEVWPKFDERKEILDIEQIIKENENEESKE